MQELDILVLGAGWTATFLLPLLREHKLLFAATTSDGRTVAGSPTLAWRFDPAAPPPAQQAAFAALPRARHVLVTFPLQGAGQSKLLVDAYTATHGGHGNDADPPHRFIQLGSTGIWQAADPSQAPWLDRRSPYARGDGSRSSARVEAEDELLGLGGCVLDLAGLWGGARDPRHWVGRVAATKEAVRARGSLHMVHGVDVARVIVAVVRRRRAEEEDGGAWWGEVGRGQRWMVTDGFVYDWWSLFVGWAEEQKAQGEEVKQEGAAGRIDSEPSRQARWVYELMEEEGVRALPRSMEALGRCYDSRELWKTLGITPLKAGLGL